MSLSDTATPYPAMELGKAGVYKDVSIVQVPDNGFSDVLNIRFRKGKVASSPGWALFNPTSLGERIMHGDNYVRTDLVRALVLSSSVQSYVATETGLVAISGGAWTGGDNDFFSSATTQDRFLITNSIEPVRKYDGTTMTDLGGMTDAEPGGVAVKARMIGVFQDFVVVFHTFEDGVRFPWRVRWCVRGQPEVWKNAPSGAGQAGYNDLDDTSDYGVGMMELGNTWVLYKENNMYTMTYVGPPTIFAFRRVVTGVGLLAQRAVVSRPGYHFFAGNDNFYRFDGVTAIPIGDDKIKEWFFSNLNPLYRDRTLAVIVKAEDEILWNFCSTSSGGDPDYSVVYNYKSDTWAIRQVPANAWMTYQQAADYTWDTIPDLPWNSLTGVWDDAVLIANSVLDIFGTVDGYLMKYGGNFSWNGAPYIKRATTGLSYLKLPGIKKRLLRLQLDPVSIPTEGLQVRIGYCATVNDPITWSQTYIVPQTGKPWIDVDLTAVYFIYEFWTEGIDDPWEVVNYISWAIPHGFE